MPEIGAWGGMKERTDKIKVLLLASGDLWAGAEVMVHQLVLGLVKTDFVDLLVILMNKGRLADELARLGVKVEIVDELGYSFARTIGIIQKLVWDFSPNVIHSHRYKENVLAWCVSRGRAGCTLVATQHGMPESLRSLSITERLRTSFFFRLLSTSFAQTVVVSEEMQRTLVNCCGFSKKNTTVIHNGITISELVVAKRTGRLVVGSAGRLFPVKDFSLLINIARSVVEKNNTIDFVLAGDGPELAMLEDKVGRYGLDGRFRFLGHQEDMDSFYAGLDLYINTSIHEGIPMSVLEAMSYGLPVVAPKVGGFPEIVDEGVCGFLVEGRHPEKFAHAILRLSSFEERRRMGQAARERAIASFSQEVMVQRYIQLYNELSPR